jgi:mannose-6-phosphate isomerase-like protein (cupin superfamily)
MWIHQWAAGVLFLSMAIAEQARCDSPAAASKRFETAELLARQEAAGEPYMEFLDQPSMSAGLYHLDAGATDRQNPHTLDEIYYVISGRAKLAVEDQDLDVQPGGVLFVAAGAEHRFHTIREALDLVVVFSKQRPSAGVQWRSFTAAEIVAPRNASQNIWNPFLQVATMGFGMYLLPQAVGGDQTLVHPWDELNLVTAGAGRFTAGTETHPIQSGTILFVSREVGHYFHDLASDLEVLILWEGPDPGHD